MLSLAQLSPSMSTSVMRSLRPTIGDFETIPCDVDDRNRDDEAISVHLSWKLTELSNFLNNMKKKTKLRSTVQC